MRKVLGVKLLTTTTLNFRSILHADVAKHLGTIKSGSKRLDAKNALSLIRENMYPYSSIAWYLLSIHNTPPHKYVLCRHNHPHSMACKYIVVIYQVINTSPPIYQ